ncbi:MAG TPA: hypothetical protein VNZ53_53730 [Steroidobacteraceae bacterium]|jgi:hypothetical protein|nr:hypothetical protein [Steroidobacteraceae bacterium]
MAAYEEVYLEPPCALNACTAFKEEPGRRAAARLLTRDEARRIAEHRQAAGAAA